jgi:hypothetical protein
MMATLRKNEIPTSSFFFPSSSSFALLRKRICALLGEKRMGFRF